MKTSELIGEDLDWAVAKCEGRLSDLIKSEYGLFIRMPREGVGRNSDYAELVQYQPSSNWAQGGLIVSNEINVLEKEQTIGMRGGLNVMKGMWHRRLQLSLIRGRRGHTALRR